MSDVSQEAKAKVDPRLVKIVIVHGNVLRTLYTIMLDYGYTEKKKSYYIITTNNPMGSGKGMVQKHFIPISTSFEILQLDNSCVTAEMFADIFKKGYCEETVRVGKRIETMEVSDTPVTFSPSELEEAETPILVRTKSKGSGLDALRKAAAQAMLPGTSVPTGRYTRPEMGAVHDDGVGEAFDPSTNANAGED